MSELDAEGFFEETKDPKFEAPPPPLCVYCSAPWTDDMLVVFAKADYYHGYYGEFEMGSTLK